ncbi:hypothetical protein VP01_2351g1 [Puccinia sorghi]|uniref:Uncharacterized protein n=1 Tax=Puccinia sorghi TaxID=27349 RepID=A0A0L6V7F6_9BASI|nr:hypothetical protein VP01_2351g1 [Puccinia sorghi]
MIPFTIEQVIPSFLEMADGASPALERPMICPLSLAPSGTFQGFPQLGDSLHPLHLCTFPIQFFYLFLFFWHWTQSLKLIKLLGWPIFMISHCTFTNPPHKAITQCTRKFCGGHLLIYEISKAKIPLLAHECHTSNFSIIIPTQHSHHQLKPQILNSQINLLPLFCLVRSILKIVFSLSQLTLFSQSCCLLSSFSFPVSAPFISPPLHDPTLFTFNSLISLLSLVWSISSLSVLALVSHAPARLPSKLHMFPYVDVLAYCANGWSFNRSFLGVCQLQAVEQVFFVVLISTTNSPTSGNTTQTHPHKTTSKPPNSPSNPKNTPKTRPNSPKPATYHKPSCQWLFISQPSCFHQSMFPRFKPPSYFSSIFEMHILKFKNCKKKLAQLAAVDMQKHPGSFCCYSNHSPKVIQPSFDAQSPCILHSYCAKSSTHANICSLDGSLAGACRMSTAGMILMNTSACKIKYKNWCEDFMTNLTTWRISVIVLLTLWLKPEGEQKCRGPMKDMNLSLVRSQRTVQLIFFSETNPTWLGSDGAGIENDCLGGKYLGLLLVLGVLFLIETPNNGKKPFLPFLIKVCLYVCIYIFTLCISQISAPKIKVPTPINKLTPQVLSQAQWKIPSTCSEFIYKEDTELIYINPPPPQACSLLDVIGSGFWWVYHHDFDDFFLHLIDSTVKNLGKCVLFRICQRIPQCLVVETWGKLWEVCLHKSERSEPTRAHSNLLILPPLFPVISHDCTWCAPECARNLCSIFFRYYSYVFQQEGRLDISFMVLTLAGDLCGGPFRFQVSNLIKYQASTQYSLSFRHIFTYFPSMHTSPVTQFNPLASITQWTLFIFFNIISYLKYIISHSQSGFRIQSGYVSSMISHRIVSLIGCLWLFMMFFFIHFQNHKFFSSYLVYLSSMVTSNYPIGSPLSFSVPSCAKFNRERGIGLNYLTWMLVDCCGWAALESVTCYIVCQLWLMNPPWHKPKPSCNDAKQYSEKKNFLNCLKLTCSMLQPSCHPNSTLTVHQTLVESLLENGWSDNRSFLGVSASQLQAVEQVFFLVLISTTNSPTSGNTTQSEQPLIPPPPQTHNKLNKMNSNSTQTSSAPTIPGIDPTILQMTSEKAIKDSVKPSTAAPTALIKNNLKNEDGQYIFQLKDSQKFIYSSGNAMLNSIQNISRPKLKSISAHILARYKGGPSKLTRQCVHVAFIFGGIFFPIFLLSSFFLFNIDLTMSYSFGILLAIWIYLHWILVAGGSKTNSQIKWKPSLKLQVLETHWLPILSSRKIPQTQLPVVLHL